MQEPDIHELDTQEVETSGLATRELDSEALDTADDGASSGRHRAPASTARRVSLRLALAALGIFLATGLGTVAADLVGLSDAFPAPHGAPLPLPLVARDRVDEPRPGRATGLTAGQVATGSGTDVPLADPSPEIQLQAADDPPPAPTAETPSPATVPTVRTGDSCPAVGQKAVTVRGDAAVCTASPGKGPNKWRAA